MKTMKISKKTFGVLSSGKTVYLYTLKVGEISLSVSTYGATLTSLRLPSRKTPAADVLLGYPALEGYLQDRVYLGSTVGRFAGRIGGGAFTLGEKSYRLYRNDGNNALHGGRRGFSRRVWDAAAYETGEAVCVRLFLESPDGDEGYPGSLRATVTYGLTSEGELFADYHAQVDAPSPVNLTNHAYFNLAGEGQGDENGTILGHMAKLYASSYVEMGEGLIPTGKILDVEGGPYDFRGAKLIGRDLAAAGGGYDDCFVIDGEPGKLRPCAEIYEDTTGRAMKVFTTQPAVVFYTGNFLDGVAGKPPSRYGKHAGFCLETQGLPDSPNQGTFPSGIFSPAREYRERTVFSFAW